MTSRQENAGPITRVHPCLKTLIDLTLVPFSADDFASHVDFAFCCLPHAASADVIRQLLDLNIRVVDLSADYRLNDWKTFESWYNVRHPDRNRVGHVPYGLPELFRELIPSAPLVANPGCFPTSAILPLAPLLQQQLISADCIVVDSKSGVSGAGREPKPHLHFPQCNESVAAYAVGQHRHMPEMEHILLRYTAQKTSIVFAPHLIPMDRGILSTIYVRGTGAVSAAEVFDSLEKFYADQPFVRICQDLPSTKNVSHTNFCDIAVRQCNQSVVLVSVLDNLVKGASGAAVQNFNLMNDFDETTGLV